MLVNFAKIILVYGKCIQQNNVMKPTGNEVFLEFQPQIRQVFQEILLIQDVLHQIYLLLQIQLYQTSKLEQKTEKKMLAQYFKPNT